MFMHIQLLIRCMHIHACVQTLSFLAVPSPCSSFLTPFPLSGGSSKAAGGGSSKQAAAALAKQQRSKQQQADSSQAPEGKS